MFDKIIPLLFELRDVVFAVVSVGAVFAIGGVSVMYCIYTYALKSARIEPMGDFEVPDDFLIFAEKNDFEYQGSYRMQICSTSAEIAGWKHKSRPMFMCYYMVEAGKTVNCSCDFVTYFGGDYALTTGSTKDGHLHPQPPKSYMQSFAKIDINEQWAKHREAESYIMFNGNLALSSKEYEFMNSVQDAIKKQADYLLSFPLWFCMGVWRFFVRRHLWANKSIEVQHRKGMIKMPGEAA